MRTILFETPSAEPRGGGQLSLLLLIERLDRSRFSPLLIVPAEGEVARRARAAGCRVRVFPFPPLRSIFGVVPAALRLRRLLKEEHIALIHAERPRSAFYLALARTGLGIPLVWHVRTGNRDPLDRLLERSADRLVLVAKALAGRFSERGRRKSVVIYNGVDTEPPAPVAASLPRRRSPLIVCAGRLERDKGQHLLLEALAVLKPEFPGIGVWLVGRDEEGFGRELRRRAEAFGDGIEFLGPRDDAAGLMSLADVVALPSAHEAFPRVVLEAMAAGRPVVATRVGGVAEAVDEGRTGLLVPPGDAKALADALGRLLRDAPLRARMGEAGARRARLFSTRAMTAAVEKLYGELLGSPRCGPASVLMVSDEIFPDSRRGGLSRGTWQEALSLRKRGHDVRVWCLDRAGGRESEETIDGLPVYRLDASASYRDPLSLPRLLGRARSSLDGVFSGFRPDVVIGQSPLSSWLVLRAPQTRGLRFVYRYNSSWPAEYSVDRPGWRSLPGRLARAWIERRVVARADAVATISGFMNRDFSRRYRLPAAMLQAGVDFERFRPGDKDAARRRLGLSGEPLLLTVRNLRPRMGWDNFLGAVELLRAERPGLKAVVVGEGPLRSELESRVARRGLEGVVRLAGRAPDDELPLYYQAADVFVMPSSALEGLGLALLEALACGARCAATPVGGMPEVLRPVEPGWVAEAAAPAALADAIRRALGSRLSADELRAAARARYGWDRMAEGLESLFARRPRLLHLITRLDIGGSAESAALSCEGARREGFELALASGPSSTAVAEAARVPLIVLPSLAREISPPRDLRAFLEIFRLLRAWKPDVLHTHSSKAGLLGRWAARLSRALGDGPRLVVHTPHGHVFYGYFGRAKTALFIALERLSARVCDVLVALSAGERNDHLALGIGKPEQWRVVPSGVEFPVTPPKADAGAPSGCLVIGTVARLEPVKGVDVLLEAAARLPRRGDRPVRLLIVGDGDEAAALKARAARLGLSDVVSFAGYRSDPIALMRVMDVYVQPSRNEGMGKALATALALGLPVAASRVCGIPDIVEDGETGLLVPPEDPAALARALERLVSDEELRRRLGEAARRRMQARDETGARVYSAESMVLRLNKLYRAGLAAAALALLGLPASAATLKVVLHAHSVVSHGGVESLERIAERAEKSGVDVLIPTDTFVADWEYGFWPLRGLVRRRVVEPSVLVTGVASYLAQIKSARERHPGLVVIPGVEAAAYYRWEGAPWSRLTINDWDRHLLVVGPEDAGAYARLPALGNPNAGARDLFLLWPLVPLALFFAAWRRFRRRRFLAAALVCAVLLANGRPYRRQSASPYAARTPWQPYQELIDAARSAGALAIWAHPDAPNWAGGSPRGGVVVRTDPYPEALVQTVGYDGFGVLKEGLKSAGTAGGSWDRALTLYLAGRREKPGWAFAELDYRDPAKTAIDAALMIVDAAGRAPRDVLAALAQGRFYSVQASAHHPLVLREYRLSGRGSASAGSGGVLRGVREPRLDLSLANEDGSSGEAQVEIIRDGEIVVKQTVSVPGRWSFGLVNDASRCYYRAIVGEGNNVLVTNPIFAFEER